MDFFKRISGTWYGPYAASGNIGIVTGTSYRVKVIAEGSTFKAYVNGTLRSTWSDTSLTEGKIGLRVAAAHVHYDDITVKTIPGNTFYHYDGNNVIAETDENNSPKATYDYTGGYQPSAFNRYIFSDAFSTDLSKWLLPSGGWTIVSGELSANSAGDETMISNQTFTDATYQAQIKAETGNDIGLFFRASDTSNGYLFRSSGLDQISGQPVATIWKKQAGTYTQIANGPITAPTLNSWYTLRVEVNGTTIKGYLNNKLVVTVTDTTFASGKVGIRATNAYGSSHHIDNVGVYNTYYYHTNTRGDVVAMVNQAGSIVAKYTYDPAVEGDVGCNGSCCRTPKISKKLLASA